MLSFHLRLNQVMASHCLDTCTFPLSTHPLPSYNNFNSTKNSQGHEETEITLKTKVLFNLEYLRRMTPTVNNDMILRSAECMTSTFRFDL